eukprot:4579628-Alexandrium_andersonii.AAC.1
MQRMPEAATRCIPARPVQRGAVVAPRRQGVVGPRARGPTMRSALWPRFLAGGDPIATAGTWPSPFSTSRRP